MLPYESDIAEYAQTILERHDFTDPSLDQTREEGGTIYLVFNAQVPEKYDLPRIANQLAGVLTANGYENVHKQTAYIDNGALTFRARVIKPKEPQVNE